MRPTEILSKEHRVIERILAVYDRIASQAEEGTGPDPKVAATVLDLLKEFADRFHHAKEEAILFPQLELHGFGPDSGPVAVMLQEHEIGRGFIRDAVGAIPEIAGPDGKRKFATAARGYLQLLSQHIYKEDQILFQMAEQVLSEPEKQELQDRFMRADVEGFGEGAFDRFEKRVEALERC